MSQVIHNQPLGLYIPVSPITIAQVWGVSNLIASLMIQNEGKRLFIIGSTAAQIAVASGVFALRLTVLKQHPKQVAITFWLSLLLALSTIITELLKPDPAESELQCKE
jgi:hypothetical protein